MARVLPEKKRVASPMGNRPRPGLNPEELRSNGAYEVLAAWQAFSDSRVDLAGPTKENYRRVVRNVLAWAGGRPLLELPLDAFVRHRLDAGIAPRTVDLELGVLRMAVRWAKDESVIPATALLRFPRLRIDPRKYRINHRTPTPGEVGRVLDGIPVDEWRLALTVLARTGARIGEVTSLRTGDLDEGRGLLALGASASNTKTGLRWFPLDDDSLGILRGRSDRRGLPMFDFGSITDPNQKIRRRILQGCTAAGVEVFTPHGLRRMVVTRLIRAGVDPGTAASLTGHSVKVMLRLYQQVSDEDRRRAVRLASLGDLTD